MGGSPRDAIDPPVLRLRSGPCALGPSPVPASDAARRRSGRRGRRARPDRRVRAAPGHRCTRLAARASRVRGGSRRPGAPRVPHRLDRGRRRRRRRRSRRCPAPGRLRTRAARRPGRRVGAVGDGAPLRPPDGVADRHGRAHRRHGGPGDSADRGRDAGIDGGLPGLGGHRRAPVRLPGRRMAAGSGLARPRGGRGSSTILLLGRSRARIGAAGLRRRSLRAPGGGGARGRRSARSRERGRRVRHSRGLGIAGARRGGRAPVRLRASDGSGGGRLAGRDLGAPGLDHRHGRGGRRRRRRRR